MDKIWAVTVVLVFIAAIRVAWADVPEGSSLMTFQTRPGPHVVIGQR